MRFIASLVFLTTLICSCQEKHKPKTIVTNPTILPYTFDLDSIISRGKLIALVDNSTTSYFLHKGQPMGFEYELLSRFADYINVQLEIKIIYNLDSIMYYLNNGIGDIAAANITETKSRKKNVAFSDPILVTGQVLVQKNNNDLLVTKWEDLRNKPIYVYSASAFEEELHKLNKNFGYAINVMPINYTTTSEEMNKTLQLINAVSSGQIDYTIADKNIAKVQQKLLGNIDISFEINPKQNIAWAIRKADTSLLNKTNEWISKEKKSSDYYTIYSKYFKQRTRLKEKIENTYSSLSGGKISLFDEIIKKEATEIGWDWRLLAAQIYQESKFDSCATSWIGAQGLMQLLPKTAIDFGLDTLEINFSESNIRTGVSYLKWINKYWEKQIKNKTECQKFVLASYNVGIGHVIDAKNLALKYGFDPTIWNNNVADFILKKSNRKYYSDEVCKYGYCRGKEPFNYVKNIFESYEHYKNLIPSQ